MIIHNITYLQHHQRQHTYRLVLGTSRLHLLYLLLESFFLSCVFVDFSFKVTITLNKYEDRQREEKGGARSREERKKSKEDVLFLDSLELNSIRFQYFQNSCQNS